MHFPDCHCYFVCGTRAGDRPQKARTIVRKIIVKKKPMSTTASEHPSGSELAQITTPPSSRSGFEDASTVSVSDSSELASEGLKRADSVSTVAETPEPVHEPVHEPGYYYTDPESQWRHYEEDRWDEWDWPPHGWRPQPWHRAYWDKTSNYYKYNHYEWKWDKWPDMNANRSPEPASRGLQTPPPTIRSDGSAELGQVVQMLERANTGDVVLSGDASAAPAVPCEPGSKKVEAPTEKVNAPEQVGAPEAPEHVDGTLDGDQDALEAKAEELRKKKAACHARYMRYFRSIRSTGLSDRMIKKHSTIASCGIITRSICQPLRPM